jgi:hypothetical protein
MAEECAAKEWILQGATVSFIPLLPFLCTSVGHLASDHPGPDKGFRQRFSTKGMDTFVATFTLTFVASVAAELGAGETLA